MESMEEVQKNNHQITEVSGGLGIEGWKQAICSCGWRSDKFYAYDDYQITNLGRSEREHLKGVNTGASYYTYA